MREMFENIYFFIPNYYTMDYSLNPPMHPELKRLIEIEKKMKDLEYYAKPVAPESDYKDMEIKDIQHELMSLYGYDDELFLKVAKILKYPNGNLNERVPTAKEAKNFMKKFREKTKEKN